jgi:hypothetical protein
MECGKPSQRLVLAWRFAELRQILCQILCQSLRQIVIWRDLARNAQAPLLQQPFRQAVAISRPK